MSGSNALCLLLLKCWDKRQWSCEEGKPARSAAGCTACRVKAPGISKLWVVVVVVVRRGRLGTKKHIAPTTRSNRCTKACLEARLRLGLDRKS